MSEQSSGPSPQSAQPAPVAGQPEVASAPPTPVVGQPAVASVPPVQDASVEKQPGLQQRVSEIAEEKPEVAAGAAFAAGFMFAMILRRLAG